jgi:hypothetical protein
MGKVDLSQFPLGSLESRAAARALAEAIDGSADRVTVRCVCHTEETPRTPWTRYPGGCLMRVLPCPLDALRSPIAEEVI